MNDGPQGDKQSEREKILSRLEDTSISDEERAELTRQLADLDELGDASHAVRYW